MFRALERASLKSTFASFVILLFIPLSLGHLVEIENKIFNTKFAKDAKKNRPAIRQSVIYEFGRAFCSRESGKPLMLKK